MQAVIMSFSHIAEPRRHNQSFKFFVWSLSFFSEIRGSKVECIRQDIGIWLIATLPYTLCTWRHVTHVTGTFTAPQYVKGNCLRVKLLADSHTLFHSLKRNCKDVQGSIDTQALCQYGKRKGITGSSIRWYRIVIFLITVETLVAFEGCLRQVFTSLQTTIAPKPLSSSLRPPWVACNIIKIEKYTA